MRPNRWAVLFLSLAVLAAPTPILANTRILDLSVPAPNPSLEITKLAFEQKNLPFNLESAKIALLHKDPGVRTVGLMGVRHLGSTNEIPLVRPFLRDSNRNVQQKAISVLHSWSWQLPADKRIALDREVLSVAQALCTEKDLSHRALGEAKFLAWLGDTSRYPVVLDALKDKSLRVSALHSVRDLRLYEMAYEKSDRAFDWITPVVACLRDLPSDDTAWEAGLAALYEMGSPDAVAALRLLADDTRDEALKQSILKRARVLEWSIERERLR